LLSIELSLRTECKLRLKSGKSPKAKCEGGNTTDETDFPYSTIAGDVLTGKIAAANLPPNRSPLALSFIP
jgi:hypothetical protein